MKVSVRQLRGLIQEGMRPGAGELRKGDLVEIYESYEERRQTQSVRRKADFAPMTRGIVAEVEFGDDGYLRVGLTPDPDAESNVHPPDNDQVFTWVFPSMLRKV